MDYDGRVRVLTLNLWGRNGAWDGRRRVLADGFRELRPDLVAFQESVVTEGCDQGADLLGSDFHTVHQSGRSADGEGASIASRWPLGTLREVDLRVTARPTDYPCTMLVAGILAPEPFKSLLFVNHGPWYPWGAERERELQAVATARFVEEFVGGRNAHAVLAGDFNAVPDAASVRFWRGLQSLGGASVCCRDGWESVHPGKAGHIFTPRNPLVAAGDMPLELGRRIDYVMVRCGDHGPTLDVTSCELVFDEPVDGVWASDHFGVVADLAVPTSG